MSFSVCFPTTKKGGGPIDKNTPEGIYVGHNYTVDATAWFGGVIDEVAVYNKALTEKEVNDLFLGKIKERISAVDAKGKIATVWAKIKSR